MLGTHPKGGGGGDSADITKLYTVIIEIFVVWKYFVVASIQENYTHKNLCTKNIIATNLISYYNKRNAHFDVRDILLHFWTEHHKSGRITKRHSESNLA